MQEPKVKTSVDEQRPHAAPILSARYMTTIVWVARVVVGGVFTMSGIAKADDLWGSVYKIDEYLTVWGWDWMPLTLVLAAAVIASCVEFMAGASLLLGCYRRSAPMVLLALMAFMLPLSFWLWLRNPVADCGCFGDLLHISNGATFAKNLALTGFLIWPLIGYNRRVTGLFSPYSQWIVSAVLGLYILVVSVEGYAVQPLLDFRRFPVGTNLVNGVDVDDEDPVYQFIYRDADGKTKAFDAADIPSDADGWTFVDRRILRGSEEVQDGFTILENGDDITEDVIHDQDDQIIVAVPDLRRINPGQTYAINELQRYVESRGGSLTALLAPDERGIAHWRDIAMANYDIHTVEPTLLKELVRGNPGIVYLRDATILWKRSLAAIELDDFDPALPDSHRAAYFDHNGPATFRGLTISAAALLLIIMGIDFAFRKIRAKKSS